MINRQKLKPCPFCGSGIRIFVCDDEGNLHTNDYEKDPWSGLGYKLYHDITDDPTEKCPIAQHEGEGEMGIWIYNTREEAIEAWNRRTSQPTVDVSDTNVGKWIPCSERLPKIGQQCLITIQVKDVCLMEKSVYWKECWWVKGERIRVEEVTAWMPLPKPYKGVE